MIVLRSTYTGTDDEVAALRDAHLAWLAGLIQDGTVIAAGRLDPATGAAVIGRGTDAAALLERFDEDPYVAGGVAHYEELVSFAATTGNEAVRALDAA